MKKEDNGVKQIDREKNLKFKKIWNIVTKTKFRKNLNTTAETICK